jgi:hypothetical protein
MALTIDEINQICESAAKVWEEEKLPKNSWPKYYRGLKNFTDLDLFRLSSADSAVSHQIYQYIVDNNLNYKTTPGTGVCVFEKLS